MINLNPAERTRVTGSEREQTKTIDAARQFEALLVAQMLKTVQEAGGGGWLGSGEDASAAPALEFAQEQFAQALCAGGGLGLAKMVADGLATRSAEVARAASAGAD